MIPDVDRKWSRQKMQNGMEFGFLDIFNFFNFTFIFIYFLQLNDELDKHKEKIFWRRKLWFKSNSHDHFILFSFDNSSEKLLEKSQLVDSNTISQQARSTTITA